MPARVPAVSERLRGFSTSDVPAPVRPASASRQVAVVRVDGRRRGEGRRFRASSRSQTRVLRQRTPRRASRLGIRRASAWAARRRRERPRPRRGTAGRRASAGRGARCGRHRAASPPASAAALHRRSRARSTARRRRRARAVAHQREELARVEMGGAGRPGMRGLRDDRVVARLREQERAARVVHVHVHARIGERVASRAARRARGSRARTSGSSSITSIDATSAARASSAAPTAEPDDQHARAVGPREHTGRSAEPARRGSRAHGPPATISASGSPLVRCGSGRARR